MIIEDTHDISEGIQTPEDGTIIMENTHNSEETQSNTQEIENKNYNKAKSDKKRKHNAHSQERLNLLEQIANRNSNQSGLDEIDLFFASMAKIVKKLPPYEQVQLRLQIGSLFGNAELRQISNNSPQDSALSPRPSTTTDYYANFVPSPTSTSITTSNTSGSLIVAPPQDTSLITDDAQPGTRLITVDEQGQVYLVWQN